MLSVIALVGQLAWPSLVYWWQLPTPGTVGYDLFECPAMAPRFLVSLPKTYHTKESWPLVVFLHGSGERGLEPGLIQRYWPIPSGIPAIVVAPQCLPGSTWEAEYVVQFVKYAASRYHVNQKRIYLMGYSMGGFGTWQTAATFPNLFAAIVPIAGGGNPQSAESLAATPTWAFHGESDEVVLAEQTKRMIRALRAVGGRPHTTILPGKGHGICRSVRERSDLWEWLFQQSQ